MAHVKLELDDLGDAQVAQLAQTIITKLTGNANVPVPNPTLAALTALVATLNSAIGNVGAAEAALTAAMMAKNAARDALETALTLEGSTVETATGGDPVKITTTGMGVQSAPTHITSMDPVQDFSVTMGDGKGTLDWHCHRVNRAKTYNARISIGAAPGAWTMVPGSSRSKGEITGQTSGTQVWVQVQAVGPNSLVSAWSTAIGCIVP